MATIFKKEHKTDRPVVLFIADGLAEQCEMIRQALVKAQTALQIGDVFLLDPGDLPLLQHKIRDMLKGNKIDLIIAPRRIYDILRRLGLAHLFVDLHSLLFDGESKPEVFYAEPGIYGIAGTGNPGRFDLVVPPDVIEKLKERPRNVEDLLKDKGVPGPGGGPVHPQAPCDIGSQDPWGAKFKFGPGSASCELRRSFGMQDPPLPSIRARTSRMAQSQTPMTQSQARTNTVEQRRRRSKSWRVVIQLRQQHSMMTTGP